MKRNHLIGFAIAAAVLCILALAAWRFLEIYPRTRRIPSSGEARANQYLALDRWLEETGRPVRTVDSGNLFLVTQAQERQIFVQASLYRWTLKDVDFFSRWIEECGSLFLSLDYPWGWYDDEIFLLLEKFGIETGMEFRSDPNDIYRFLDNAPQYDYTKSFGLAENSKGFTLKDSGDVIRLVQARRGKGKLTVTGNPYFLHSANIGIAHNARLAWAFFGADSAAAAGYSIKDGWLFIRGTTRVRGIFGSLFRQGNLTVLAVSAIVLLIISFWAVIPVFGLVRHEKEIPGKPLGERFLAEGRFLNRYGALEIYRDRYIRKIRRRLTMRGSIRRGVAEKESAAGGQEMYEKIMEILGEANRLQVPPGSLPNEPITYREFPAMIAFYNTILERI